jgi:hypothetical protein
VNGVGACKCHPTENAILRTARDELTLARQLGMEGEKLAFAADIDTIQSQLAKTNTSNKNIVAAAWDSVKGAA